MPCIQIRLNYCTATNNSTQVPSTKASGTSKSIKKHISYQLDLCAWSSYAYIQQSSDSYRTIQQFRTIDPYSLWSFSSWFALRSNVLHPWLAWHQSYHQETYQRRRPLSSCCQSYGALVRSWHPRNHGIRGDSQKCVWLLGQGLCRSPARTFHPGRLHRSV